MKNLSHRYPLNLAKFKTETNHNAENEAHDEEFESAKPAHRPRWAVKNENNEHVDDGDGAASYQGHVQEDIKSNGRSNDLKPLTKSNI